MEAGGEEYRAPFAGRYEECEGYRYSPRDEDRYRGKRDKGERGEEEEENEEEDEEEEEEQ